MRQAIVPFLLLALFLFGAVGLISCKAASGQATERAKKYPVQKSEAEWKKILSEDEFYVLRKAGTERAFTGDLLKNKEKGTYTCAACGQALFSSDTKFKSGTGWPSFYEPISAKAIDEHADNAFGMTRTEVVCSRCGGHLGHVFDDGPKPTGLRYCINSVSLNFEPAKTTDK